jgi:hypothetical protein
MNQSVEVSVWCPNCGNLDTLDMQDGNLDTCRVEEHDGVMCPATGKYYQFMGGVIYHKCQLSGRPIVVQRGIEMSFRR